VSLSARSGVLGVLFQKPRSEIYCYVLAKWLRKAPIQGAILTHREYLRKRGMLALAT